MNLNKDIKEYLDCNYSDGEDRSGSNNKIIFTPDGLQEACEDLIEFLIEFDLIKEALKDEC